MPSPRVCGLTDDLTSDASLLRISTVLIQSRFGEYGNLIDKNVAMAVGILKLALHPSRLRGIDKPNNFYL